MKNSVFIAAGFLFIFQTVFSPANQNIRHDLSDSGQTELVPLVSSDIILNEIQADANVIFVDAREPEEFAEDHLPGAINMTLRQVNREAADRLRDADLVVTYCLKDFRGYEVGRALKNHGLTNVRLMKDHGIHGWKNQALPMTSRGGMTDQESMALLRKCAADINDCRTRVST